MGSQIYEIGEHLIYIIKILLEVQRTSYERHNEMVRNIHENPYERP